MEYRANRPSTECTTSTSRRPGDPQWYRRPVSRRLRPFYLHGDKKVPRRHDARASDMSQLEALEPLTNPLSWTEKHYKPFVVVRAFVGGSVRVGVEGIISPFTPTDKAVDHDSDVDLALNLNLGKTLDCDSSLGLSRDFARQILHAVPASVWGHCCNEPGDDDLVGFSKTRE
ncbi:hypothetical protein EVAR_53570_1 [Eumeta japonica]|uniref:Uncharacterized protein n=1 Tax=Eumeta variegata TaxID=151549 RepID=A0A4C1YLL0_EUMVA|nr:hypothetical protein EVAR_53570_1 [Eumeta japonica]